jgi:HNH endonuclease
MPVCRKTCAASRRDCPRCEKPRCVHDLGADQRQCVYCKLGQIRRKKNRAAFSWSDPKLSRRFFRFTRRDEQTGCLLWTGKIGDVGYGVFRVLGENVRAHRVAYAIAHGALPPPGRVVRHKCDRPACVDETHLLDGTQKDNLQDMTDRGRRVTTPRKGVKHHKAKLTDEQVRFIRAQPKGGDALAQQFGVRRSTIVKIRSRQAWRHI